MLAAQINDIDETLLQEACAQHWQEGQTLKQAVKAFASGMDGLGVSGQVALGVALLDVRGYKLATEEFGDPVDAPHEHVVIPEILQDEFRPDVDAQTVVAPVLDILAQAFGLIKFPKQANRY